MKRAKYIFLGIAFIAILGIAGNYDWAEEVLESVPCEVYNLIKKELGGNPSEVEIAEYYLDHKLKYDNIAINNGW